MSAAHVRRGASGRTKARRSTPKVGVPKKIAKRLPVDQARANKIAGMVFGAFIVAIGIVVLIALDIPAKAERAAGTLIGRAGFTVSGYQIVGIANLDRVLVDDVVTGELRSAAQEAGAIKAPQTLVNVAAIRAQLLHFGWVKDARVSRRLPDTLVIDIVERKPAALWQNQGGLQLIDEDGVVLDRVAVDKMPDLPLLIGEGANRQEKQLRDMMAIVPTMAPQLSSANWVGGRRWDLNFQSGEVIALPEGDKAARTALAKFAKLDKSSGLLGRGIVRFDMRDPKKMVVRLPRSPGEPIAPSPKEG
ncbi:MAG: cell division protein FtsQ/DivIB [Pseudomonadota bacterium]